MSKRLAVTFLSVGIAALVGVLVWTISTKGGWFGGFWSGQAWARGPERSIKTYDADPKDIDTVIASFASEDVMVSKWDGNTIHVEQFANTDLTEQQQMRIRQDGSRIIIESGLRNHGFVMFGSMPSCRIEIQIPERLKELSVSTVSGENSVDGVEADKMSASSTSGDVQMIHVASQAIDCSSTSGEVTVQAPQCTTLSASTTSGSISAESDVSLDAALSSVSGDVALIGAAGTANLSTTSGDIHGEFRTLARIEADSTSGTIDVRIDDAASLKSVSADTMSGDVLIEVPSGTAVSADFASVSGKMRTETGSGGIELRDTGIPVHVGTTSGDLVISTTGVRARTGDERPDSAQNDSDH